MRVIDTRGELCPKPIIMTKKELSNVTAGEVFDVLTDNLTSLSNLERFLTDNGFDYNVENEGTYHILHVQKNGEIILNNDEVIECQPMNKKITTVVFKSDKMGIGNDELGAILIKGFINALKEQSTLPDQIIFYNSGVLLTSSDCPLSVSLKELEKLHCQLIICGTCADYFQIKDKIKMGVISNMFSILEKLEKSDKIIYP